MPPKFSVKRVALLLAPLVLAAVVLVPLMANRIESEAKRRSEEVMLNWFEMTSPTPRRLDPQFTDADQDLIADTPKDAALQVLPEKLYFSYIAGPEAHSEIASWQDLIKHLSTATGMTVEPVSFETTQEQLTALTSGKLHVTGFNTGAVPVAVASCGFVPICTFGRDDGTFGTTMRIIVPAKSSMRKLQDLKGSTIAFTTRDSNSGCKAALALFREHELLPLRDYEWKFSGGHDESIKGVAGGYYPAAPVAADLLDRAIARGDVKADDLRTIYESERFPPATLGCVYLLPPEVQQKLRDGLLSFAPQGTSMQEQFTTSGVSKFVPISYKQDFALIRRIDDAFRKPGPSASN